MTNVIYESISILYCTIPVYFLISFLISLKKHQSVSECVCLFPNSSETAYANDLKFRGMIPLGMEKVLG